jgi:hypothetical protein
VIKLNLSHLSEDIIHIFGFDGEDAAVMLLDAVPQVATVVSHG